MLDPGISLQANPPQAIMNPAQAGSMVQSLSAASNNQAALPGIQADSAIKQRAAAFNQWISDNSQDFVTPAKDSNGNLTPGVTPTINVQGLAAKAAAAGFTNEALSMNAADLKNKASQIKNASDFQDLALKTRAAVSTYMEAYTHPQDKDGNPTGTAPGPAATQQEYDKVVGGIGNMFGMGGQKLFGTPTGTNDQGQSFYKYDPATNKAMAIATMSPEVQTELQQRQEQLNQSGVQGQSGPEWRDLNSDITKNAQAAAIKGGMDPAIAGKMTAAQLAQDKNVGAIVTGAIIPAPTKGTLVNGSIELRNKQIQLNAAADALEAARSQGVLPDEALNAPLAWFKTHAGAIAQNKYLQAAATQVGAIDSANPADQLGNKDYGSLGFALRQKALTTGQLADTTMAAVPKTTFKEVPPAQEKAATNPMPSAQPMPAVGERRTAANAAIKNGASADAVKARFKKLTGEDL